MKSKAVLALAILVLAGTALAQAPPQPAAPAPEADKLAAGTIVSVELSKSLDAKKSKPNDKVEAKTSMDLLQHGQIVIPRNTKIIGHVTETKARSKTSPDSLVGITFDRLLMKDGREVPLQVAVQAIGRPLDLAHSEIGSGPDSLTDVSSMPGQLPPVGSQAPVGGSSSSTLTPRYPSNLPEPSSRTLNGSNNSTLSPLSPTSQGAVGMKGLSLGTSGQASVVSSQTENVHLDTGTQLILRVQ